LKINDTTQTLLVLESQVYLSEVRRSPELSAALFEEDFVEFGSNGQIFDRAEIVKVLAEGPPLAGKISLEDFAVKPLAEGLALATYRLEIRDEAGEVTRQSLRSTIYREEDGTWRQVFHQATMIPV